MELFINYQNILHIIRFLFKDIKYIRIKWRPPSLSELTPMIFNLELTHLSSEVCKLYRVSLLKLIFVTFFSHSKKFNMQKIQ